MTISVSRLQTFYGHLDAESLLRAMILEEFPGKIALVSSFGADAALLLALVAEVDKATPILFLETEKHFQETLDYVDSLSTHLGLTNVIQLHPDPALLANIDPHGTLWEVQPHRCCYIRKVEPLEKAIKEKGFVATITGRKRYQTLDRADMQTIEMDDKGVIKINPLARYSRVDIEKEFLKRNLPKHPLLEQGYLSIGCAPCTRPVKPNEDERAGRWAHTSEFPGGEQKTECGIHVTKDDAPDWSV